MGVCFNWLMNYGIQHHRLYFCLRIDLLVISMLFCVSFPRLFFILLYTYMRKAILAGATGLIGSELLKIILENSDYQEVVCISRNEVPVQNKKLVQLIINFDDLDKHVTALNGDVFFCCLGTTRNQTPNKNQYRQIEYGYPVKLGEIAKANHVKQYHYVSSIGADANTSNFYLKNKGEAETALTNLNLPSLHIYQPSALTGKRAQSRPLDGVISMVIKAINPLLVGKFEKYRSIAASTVASAMYKQSLTAETGLFIHPSDHIKKLA